MVRRVLRDPEFIDNTESNFIWSTRDADSEMQVDLRSKQKCKRWASLIGIMIVLVSLVQRTAQFRSAGRGR